MISQQHSSTVVSAHRATASAQRRIMKKYFVPENECIAKIERERASNPELQWMFPLALAEEMAACLKMSRKDANKKYESLKQLWPHVKTPSFKNFWDTYFYNADGKHCKLGIRCLSGNKQYTPNECVYKAFFETAIPNGDNKDPFEYLKRAFDNNYFYALTMLKHVRRIPPLEEAADASQPDHEENVHGGSNDIFLREILHGAVNDTDVALQSVLQVVEALAQNPVHPSSEFTEMFGRLVTNTNTMCNAVATMSSSTSLLNDAAANEEQGSTSHPHAEIFSAASALKLSPFRGHAAALSSDASFLDKNATRSESGCSTPTLGEEGTEGAAAYVQQQQQQQQQQQHARGAASDIAGSWEGEDIGFVCSETSPPDSLKNFQELLTVNCQEPFNEMALLADENVEAPESFSPFGGSPTDPETAALSFLGDSPHDCSVKGEDFFSFPAGDTTEMGDEEAWFFANFSGF